MRPRYVRTREVQMGKGVGTEMSIAWWMPFKKWAADRAMRSWGIPPLTKADKAAVLEQVRAHRRAQG